MSIEDYALYDGDAPTATGFPGRVVEQTSADVPWALVERFSELTRVSGSEDEVRAAEYLIEQLEAHEVPVERFGPELWLSIPGEASLRATAPVSESFESVKTISFSGSGTARGEVVYVEAPSAETMEEMLNASVGEVDVDVDGKIVLIAAMSLSTETIAGLQAAGAEAFVGIHPHEREPHEGIATPIWGAVPAPDERDKLPEMLIANVSATDGERLIELATGDDPLEVEVTAEATRGWHECPLVLSRIPAEAPDAHDDEFVLLHGHYDSWHVGIADNATGDAALLELARVFNENRGELKRDLWVAWWPGHSTGRYAGSTWFADEFAHELVDECVAQVNVDSPGAADATEFEMVMWMPEAGDLVREAVREVCGKEAEGIRPPRAGDYSFNNLGLSGLFMLSSSIPADVREARGYHPVGGCGMNSDAWHLTTDTLDKADPDVLVRDVQVHAYALARLLGEDVVPLDHRNTVEDHVAVVEEYDELAGEHFDFVPVLAELGDLAAAVDDLYEAIEEGEIDPQTANAHIKDLSRALVRLNFTSEGPFEQDPAIERPPYPTLEPATGLEHVEGDDRRFRQVHLRRARNAVVHTLRTARRGLE